MENINLIIENLGLLKALADQANELVEIGKKEVKAKGINITNSTATIKTSDNHPKVYTEENQKKIDKLKKKCAEEISKIPFEKTEIKNASVRITSSVDADDNAKNIIMTLLNPNTKDNTINFINDLLK